MNEEHVNKLKNDFPRLFTERFGFNCGDGWFKLLYRLAQNIDPEIDKLPKDVQDSVCFSEIKEKFGTLRIYINGPQDGMDRIYTLVHYAEYHSAKVCEICGENGIIRKDILWVRTLCDIHYREVIDRRRKNKNGKKKKQVIYT